MDPFSTVLLGGSTIAALVAARLVRHPSAARYWFGGALIFVIIAVFPTATLALTSRGIFSDLTGEVGFLDGDWLVFGLVFSAGWSLAAGVLAIGAPGALERIMPLLFVGILMAVGVSISYSWEVRDANAYVSTSALPALRAESDGRTPVPSEFVFERETNTPALVTNPAWLDEFNTAAAQSDAVRSIEPTRLTRRQLLAVNLGFAVAGIIWLASQLPWRRWTRNFDRAHHLLALGFAGLVALGLPASVGTNSLPALVQVGAFSVTVFELVKVFAIVAFAVSLTRREWKSPGGTAAVTLIALSILGLGLIDLGAGLTVGLIALVMSTLAMNARARRVVLALTLAIPLLTPFVAAAGGSFLPGAAEERVSHWTDPWGSHDRATIINLANDAARDVNVARAARAEPVEWDAAIELIEQELLFRLTTGTTGATRPVIPTDTTDELLLIEAEQAWADLRGYQSVTVEHRALLETRLASFVGELRSTNGVIGPASQDHFQLQRALFAIREGGVTGVGLGQGRPEAIPTVTEDLALVVWAESSGFVGVVMVMALSLGFAAFTIAPIRHSTILPALLLVGLGVQFALQGLVNAGGIIGAVPFTGVPFPLISRSGTSAVAAGITVGLLAATFDLQKRRSAPGAVGSRAPGLAAGLTASFLVVGASYGLLMVTGSRVLTPGPLGATLDEIAGDHLLVPDQWDSPPYRAPTGAIVDRNGAILLSTPELVAPRTSPDPALATSLSHALLQLDRSYATDLQTTFPEQRGTPTLVTTIDAGVQLALSDAFDTAVADIASDPSTVRGAAVVLDADTGDIVAILSRPSFDLAELTNAATWAAAESNDRRDGFDSRYLNRAVDGAYPPGSTFKTVTAAAAIEFGLHRAGGDDFVYLDGPTGPQEPDGYDHIDTWHQLPLIDGPPVTDDNHGSTADWTFDIVDAFAYSCNVAFAEMAIDLGPDRLLEIAQRFGFERDLTIRGLGTARSSIDSDAGAASSDRSFAATTDALTRTSFGQAEVLASPISLATIAAAVANNGVIMRPRIVRGLTDEEGRWLSQGEPSVWLDTGFDDETLATLRAGFVAAVDFGTAENANPTSLLGPAVGAKTGTAEWGDGSGAPHSLIIGAFPIEDPRLVVAIVIESGGGGGGAAATVLGELAGSPAIRALLDELES